MDERELVESVELAASFGDDEFVLVLGMTTAEAAVGNVELKRRGSGAILAGGVAAVSSFDGVVEGETIDVAKRFVGTRSVRLTGG